MANVDWSPEGNFTRNAPDTYRGDNFENYYLKITAAVHSTQYNELDLAQNGHLSGGIIWY